MSRRIHAVDLVGFTSGRRRAILTVSCSAISASWGAASGSPPIDEELDFGQEKFGEMPGAAELIAHTRIKQDQVAQAVSDQSFEKAANLAELRDALQDQLHRSCTA